MTKKDKAIQELCDSLGGDYKVQEEHFKYGFTMGVLLMKEIYELPDFK